MPGPGSSSRPPSAWTSRATASRLAVAAGQSVDVLRQVADGIGGDLIDRLLNKRLHVSDPVKHERSADTGSLCDLVDGRSLESHATNAGNEGVDGLAAPVVGDTTAAHRGEAPASSRQTSASWGQRIIDPALEFCRHAGLKIDLGAQLVKLARGGMTAKILDPAGTGILGFGRSGCRRAPGMRHRGRSLRLTAIVDWRAAHR